MGLACLVTTIAAGCGGSATVWLVPIQYGAIEAQAPLVVDLSAQECYYWIDPEKQQVRIAITARQDALFNENAARSLDVSLVLDGLPANNARDYRANRRTVRGTASERGDFVRFASVRGIAAVWFDQPDCLHGRVRVQAKYQQYSLLFGWHASQPVLMLGEFVAIRDRERCEAILERTENGGMERALVRPDEAGPIPVTGPPVSPDQ